MDNELNELFRWLKIHGLNSKVPTTLEDLSKRSMLDLSGNKIRELPECIGALENLSVLNLSNNRLSKLPKSIKE